MQAFDLDWNRMIELAAVWSRLPVTARLALLQKQLQVSPSTIASKLGADAKTLIDAGFAVRMTLNPAFVHLNAEYQTPLTAMRAMNRVKIFDDERATVGKYLTDVFTQAECAELVGIHGYDSYRGAAVLAERAASPEWLEAFLNRERLPRDLPSKPKRGGDRLTFMRLSPDEIHLAAKELVRSIMTRAEPVPLTEVPALLPHTDRKLVAQAIHLAIRHVVLFPALREGDFEPVLGIWPAITWRLNRPLPSKPEPLGARPPNPVDIPFRMEDLTALLVAGASEPLRLRAENGALFSKSCEKISDGMVSLPDWYSEFAGFKPEPGADVKAVPLRIERAFNLALGLKFAKRDRNDERKDALSVTPLGLAWLAQNPKDRLKALLDFAHIHAKFAPRKRREIPEFLADDDFSARHTPNDSFTNQFIWGGLIGNYWPYNWRHETHEMKIKKAISDAFGWLADGAFYKLDEFLIYHSQSANPLHALLKESPNGQKPSFSYGGYHLNEEALENIWAETLMRVFWRLLAPFGGAFIAAGPDGKIPLFSVTGISRYLLGLADDFEFAAPSAAANALVIQPNFELVFLAPSPALEASCARFCERAGKSRNIGTLFRITRKSIHAAAGTGSTADGVLDMLAKASSKALPRNVEHEIKAWFAQCRNVAVRHATLIECPDAETAGKVARNWSGKSTLLNPTVVELSASVKNVEIARKLRALGVFVRAAEKGEDDGE